MRLSNTRTRTQVADSPRFEIVSKSFLFRILFPKVRFERKARSISIYLRDRFVVSEGNPFRHSVRNDNSVLFAFALGKRGFESVCRDFCQVRRTLDKKKKKKNNKPLTNPHTMAHTHPISSRLSEGQKVTNAS